MSTTVRDQPAVALVTGATGFLGSHLVRALLDRGWSVHALTRAGSRGTTAGDWSGEAHVHAHDGTTESLHDIIGRSRPAVVFHLASLFVAQHRVEEVSPLIRSNVEFATQLLDAMVAHGVFRLVNTGTSWQHFQNASYDPVCLYAATKQALEAILTFYTAATPLSAITLKLFDTYGPDDRRRKLFALLRHAAESGEPLAMSPGGQLIDLVHVDDVVSAFVCAAERLRGGQVRGHESYAVSSGQPIPLRDLVERFAAVTGREIRVQWGERPYREREVMVPWTAGRPLPGWLPRVDLEQGLRSLG